MSVCKHLRRRLRSNSTFHKSGNLGSAKKIAEEIVEEEACVLGGGGSSVNLGCSGRISTIQLGFGFVFVFQLKSL